MEAGSVPGSTATLVGVGSSKRNRLLKSVTEKFKRRTPSEKKLTAAVLLLALLSLLLLAALIIFGVQRQDEVCFTEECVRSAGMLLADMDLSADPCQDFYRYTCGRWSENHEVEESTYSWFTDRSKFLNARISGFLDENATMSDPEPLVEAKSLYAACMDTDRLDALGIGPILNILEQVGLPKTVPSEESVVNFQLSSVLAKAQRVLSMDILIQLSLTVDNSTNQTIISIGPALGTPSLPELVPNTEEGHVTVSPRDAIALRLAYMAGVLAAIEPSANTTALPSIALRILVVDAQIKSDIQKSAVEPESTLKMTFGELQELMDSVNTTSPPKLRVDWSEYLKELMSEVEPPLGLNDTVLVENKEYLILLALRLHRTKPESFQRYIWWSIVSSMVPHSTSELRGLKEELYEALFKRPRHTRAYKCSRIVKSFFNMAISYKFAMLNNLKETSEKITWMLKDITQSFNSLVGSLPWMDRKTKEATWSKSLAIKSYIGYPDWLLDEGELDKFYKHIEINDGQFLDSMVRIKSAEVKAALETLGEVPSNKTGGWTADPLDVNAYYGRGNNAVSIPAGILQTPFYYLGLEALNYGAIGSILGHELTHAFDIEGKEYDGEGKKKSWWSEVMTKEYNNRAQCFVSQYDRFSVNKEYSVNGTLTLAENIADNGGVREAFHAYKYYVKRNGKEPYLPGMKNYTHDQLFFLAFANVWCEKTTDSDEILALGDVHSPNKFRVLGTLENSAEFADAWNCPNKAKMNPPRKCVLW